MGIIFMWIIIAGILKGFGKAMTNSGGKKRKESWDGLSYEQKAWLHDKHNGQ